MPKRKRYSTSGSRKRRRFSRSSRYRRYRRRYSRKMTLYSRVRSLEKNVEKKWAQDTNEFTPALNWVGAPLLPDLDGGVSTGSENDRIGNCITLKSLQSFLRIDRGDSSNKVRVIVVLWKQSTGASNIGDALETPTTVIGSPIYPIQSLYKKDSKILFKIMYDRIFAVNSTTSATKLAKINLRLPKSGMVLTYLNDTSTQPEKNLIEIYVCSDSAVATHPLITCNTRITYADS